MATNASTRSAMEHSNLFVIAFRYFPKSFFVKGIGLTFTISLYIYNYLLAQGIASILERILLTASIITVIPASSLYLLTLARAPRIRKREKAEALRRQSIAHGDLKALQVKEQSEAKEIIRLEAVASGHRRARKVKDKQEDDRWDSLNERMRLQEEVGQLSKDLKEVREVARQELATGDAKAQHVKDMKDDERWDLLNEKMRVQKATGQQTEDLKEEREEIRKQLAFVDSKAQKVKDLKETARWDDLTERMRVQEEAADDRSTERQYISDLKDGHDEQRREEVASEVASLLQAKALKDDKRWDAFNERLHALEAILFEIRSLLMMTRSNLTAETK